MIKLPDKLNDSFSKDEQFGFRSPEAQEVIMQIPNSVQYWSITVVSLTIACLLLLSWFVKYPDLISATVKISTIPPPVILVSRMSGKLHLLTEENALIRKGEIAAYLESNASVASVLLVEESLSNEFDVQQQVLPGSLGDLQPAYAQLMTAISSLRAFNENRLREKQVLQLRKQVVTHLKIGESIAKQEALLKQQLALAKRKFLTDSVLFAKKVTAALDYDISKSTWLQEQRNRLNIKTTLLNNEALIDGFSKQISDLEIEQLLERQRLELDIRQSKDQLLADISKWKQSYLIIAPDSGRISFLSFLEDNQHIEANAPLFSISSNYKTLIAKGELPIFGSGKVRVGQDVYIRLENYPFEQFGLISGRISSISLTSAGDSYRITIELPGQLVTSQNKTLPYTDQLSGTTEIITEDLRLLERLFYTFSKALRSR